MTGEAELDVETKGVEGPGAGCRGVVAVAEVAVGVGEPVGVSAGEQVGKALAGGEKALVGKGSSRVGEFRVGQVGGGRGPVGVAKEESVRKMAKGAKLINGEGDKEDVRTVDGGNVGLSRDKGAIGGSEVSASEFAQLRSSVFLEGGFRG
jgi:hypothetical protein